MVAYYAAKPFYTGGAWVSPGDEVSVAGMDDRQVGRLIREGQVYADAVGSGTYVGTDGTVLQSGGSDLGTVSIRKDDDGGVSNPKLQFLAANAEWRIGIDSANGTPGTDYVPIVLINNDGTNVQDFLYASFQGTAGNYPTDTNTTLIRLGVGVTPPSTGYRLQTAGGATGNNPSVGGMRSLVRSGQTGHAYVMESSSGTARWWVDKDGYMSGNHQVAGSGIAVLAEATNERPLAMARSNASAFWGFQYSGSALRFRYISGGMDVLQFESDGGFRHMSSEVGFFNTTPATRQTVTGSRGGNAALASLLTALAAYGLVTNSTTA